MMLNENKVNKILEILERETGNNRKMYEGLVWEEKLVCLEDITFDSKYYPKKPTHLYLENSRTLREDIRNNGLRDPIIVLYDNLFLADGYNRRIALLTLSIKEVKAYHGYYPDKRVAWDFINKRFYKLNDKCVESSVS